MKPITQDILDPTHTTRDSTNLLDEKDIEKTPNKRKKPTP